MKAVHFNESFPCKICNYEARCKSTLSTHVTNVHQKSENINCTECNKSIHKYHQTTHMKLFHSGEQPPQYNCKVCTFQIIHKSSLYNHVNIFHKNQKAIK